MSGLPCAVDRLWSLLRRELRQLQFNRNERRWQMPFCAALASGLPLLEAGLLGGMGTRRTCALAAQSRS